MSNLAVAVVVFSAFSAVFTAWAIWLVTKDED